MGNLVIFSVLIIMGIVLTGEATVHTVGGAAGWDISADFPSWVSNKTFYVGDSLVFMYNQYHTLNEVDKSGYDNCSTSNTLLSESSGNTTVPLTAPGDRYFICGALTHCLGGMKLEVHIQRNTTLSPIGAPVGAPLSSENPVTGSDSDGSNLPPFLSRSNQLGNGCGVFSWLCTLGTLLMVLAVRL